MNGSLEGFFSSKRGLRQGDPLSPFVFLIVMEGLNQMFQKAKERGFLKGFNATTGENSGTEITHLLYADDSLVFCNADINQVKYLRTILVIFEAVSGQCVNWNKSVLFPVNKVDNIQVLARVRGCEVGSLSTVHLGLSLGAKSKALEIWNGVIERCEKRLSNWKRQYLSLDGKIILVNSVLDALPTYVMSLFPIPSKVLKRLDSLRRNFIWQGNKVKKANHLVKWECLITNKKDGGLGIR